LLLAQEHIDSLAGQAFNIGGGVSNAVSLIEVIDLIGELHGDKPALRRAAWRLGDQKYYVSDTRKFAKATGWSAQVSVQEGVQKLYRWLRRARAASAA
jgi:CDP-paratose 2-epimerase